RRAGCEAQAAMKTAPGPRVKKPPARRPAESRTLRELRQRLAEAEDTLDALRNGEVDALHGGTVRARSAGPQTGSGFEVRIPVLTSAEHVREVRKMTPQGAVQAQRDKRVLVVDDNVDAADLLSQALEDLGYETRTAYDGTSALEAAAAFDPDIALLDI